MESGKVFGWLLLMVIVVTRVVEKGEAIWLSLPDSGTKCVSEEIHNNVVVLADYVVISDDNVHPTPTISAKVNQLKPPIFIFLFLGICFCCAILFFHPIT